MLGSGCNTEEESRRFVFAVVGVAVSASVPAAVAVAAAATAAAVKAVAARRVGRAVAEE